MLKKNLNKEEARSKQREYITEVNILRGRKEQIEFVVLIYT